MFYFIILPLKAFLSACGLFVSVVDNIEDLVLWKTFSKILFFSALLESQKRIKTPGSILSHILNIEYS